MNVHSQFRSHNRERMEREGSLKVKERGAGKERFEKRKKGTGKNRKNRARPPAGMNLSRNARGFCPVK